MLISVFPHYTNFQSLHYVVAPASIQNQGKEKGKNVKEQFAGLRDHSHNHASSMNHQWKLFWMLEGRERDSRETCQSACHAHNSQLQLQLPHSSSEDMVCDDLICDLVSVDYIAVGEWATLQSHDMIRFAQLLNIVCVHLCSLLWFCTKSEQ